MAERLSGKVAVITGGASGMGRAAALLFLHEGARVVIADLNDSKSEEVLSAAADAGFREQIRSIRTNVAEEADIKAMVELAISSFGRLDVLFNNAGVGGAGAPILDTEVEDWDRTFAWLLRSVFLGIKHGGRAMRRNGGGSIINTASVAGVGGGGGPAAYSAAKSGVINLTKNAAVQLAADRIRVNAIAPGGIHTPLLQAKDDAQMRAFMMGRQPWPDTGQSEDIANAALFLASDESRFCTGSTMLVDGGLLAWGPGIFPHAGPPANAGFNSGGTGKRL
jgi:NAD(P)-dependent dehydrogenase (short-subunit alcohol dehydrogenase family)